MWVSANIPLLPPNLRERGVAVELKCLNNIIISLGRAVNSLREVNCIVCSICMSVSQDESLLKGRIQLIEVAVNSVLGLEGDLESCVYFIASGRLKVYHLTGDQTKSQVLISF